MPPVVAGHFSKYNWTLNSTRFVTIYCYVQSKTQRVSPASGCFAPRPHRGSAPALPLLPPWQIPGQAPANKGQSNLARGGIAARRGFRSPNLPFPWRPGPLSNIMLFGTTRVSLPNDISFRPAALARCTGVSDDRQTDRRTDHVYRNRRNGFQRCCIKAHKAEAEVLLASVAKLCVCRV